VIGQGKCTENFENFHELQPEICLDICALGAFAPYLAKIRASPVMILSSIHCAFFTCSRQQSMSSDGSA
jgi:hypothetical protein